VPLCAIIYAFILLHVCNGIVEANTIHVYQGNKILTIQNTFHNWYSNVFPTAWLISLVTVWVTGKIFLK